MWSTWCAAERLEAGDVRRADVEVAAEDRRRALRPGARRGGRARDVGLRASGSVGLRVEVRAPRAIGQSHRVTDAPLGPAAQRLVPYGRDRPAHEDRVRAATV